MLNIILISLVVAGGGYLTYRLLHKANPQMYVYQKRFVCSVCGSEYTETLDYCPRCAKERETTVLLHEFFVEVKEPNIVI